MSIRNDNIKAAINGKDLSCSTTHSTGGAYKASRMLPDNSQTVAAIASEESLQLRVKKAHPPRREATPAPFGAHRCHKGVLLEAVRRCVLQKVVCCTQGPCETGETLNSPSMISVPLCTKLEMSDINSGN